MAHTKAKGTSKLGRDSIAKRLGVKIFGGQKTNAGQVLIRQRGSKYFAGEGVARGGDDTLYAKKAGTVVFKKTKIQKFTGSRISKTVIAVN